jgi:glutaminyl-peptide cyclotransferase
MLLRSVALAALLAGCQDAAPPPPEFDGDRALAYIQTQLDFGPRIPGTDGHAKMAAWLDSLLRTRADSVVVQAWDHAAQDGKTLPLRNLIARFNPGATTRILFLAHWDTRPRADAIGSRDTTAPVPGANDGASGVAVLLGMADALKTNPPAIGVDLLFVDGEDYGDFSVDKDVLMGSRYYAKSPLPGPKPRFAILLDMVGDAMLQIRQEGYSLTGAPDVVERVWKTAERLGYQTTFLNEPMTGMTDDHIPLQGIGIPAIDVIDFEYGPNNSYHHTPDDTFDKVSARSLKVVGDVAMAVIREHK